MINDKIKQSFPNENYINNEELNNYVVKNVGNVQNSNNKIFFNSKANQIEKSKDFNINNKNNIYNHTINKGIVKENEKPKGIKNSKR